MSRRPIVATLRRLERFEFDPDQVRDESGKWTSGGGGAESSPETPAQAPKLTEQEFAAKDKEYASKITSINTRKLTLDAKLGDIGLRQMELNRQRGEAVKGVPDGAEREKIHDSFNEKVAALTLEHSDITNQIGSLNDEKDAATAAAGVDYWHREMSADSALFNQTIGRTREGWAHIGGDGPMQFRLAAQMAFGLENGVAYDVDQKREVSLSEYSAGEVTLQAAAMRVEYEDTQKELENGIDLPDSQRPSFEDFSESNEYSQFYSDSVTDSFNNLPASDVVKEYVTDDDLEEIAEWADDHESEVFSETDERMPLPGGFKDEKSPEEQGLIDKHAEASKEVSDTRATMQEAVQALVEARSSHDSATDPTKPGILDAYNAAFKAQEDASVANSDAVRREIKAERDVIAYRNSDAFRATLLSDPEHLTESERENYEEALDDWHRSAAAAWVGASSGGLDIMQQRHFDGFEVDPSEEQEAYESWAQDSGNFETRSISKDDWPITLYRGMHTTGDKPNFAESWSTSRSVASGFGSKSQEVKVDRRRVLIFQGGKHWVSRAGGMGTTEFEFLLLSEPPKWFRSRSKHEMPLDKRATNAYSEGVRCDDGGIRVVSSPASGVPGDQGCRRRQVAGVPQPHQDSERLQGGARQAQGWNFPGVGGPAAEAQKALARIAFEFDPSQERDESGKWTDGGGSSDTGDDPDNHGSNRAIASEAVTEPRSGAAYDPDVRADRNGDGVTDASRVGVPADQVPPPPPIPRMPNLTEAERQVEEQFASAYERDPDAMVARYRETLASQADATKQITFGTDDVKALSPAWGDPDNRGLYNVALHQTANAVAKRAFLDRLDALKPGDGILVTNGGCGAGKGYALKNVPATKGLASQVGAIWDSAGDQNATENSWIMEEAEKRGLRPTFAYVHADPYDAWASDTKGVVFRANSPTDGRMVDSRVFVDSYAIGAQNFKNFYDKNQGKADFIFLDNRGTPTLLKGFPSDALNVDSRKLYGHTQSVLWSRSKSLRPSILRAAMIGSRLWKKEKYRHVGTSGHAAQKPASQFAGPANLRPRGSGSLDEGARGEGGRGNRAGGATEPGRISQAVAALTLLAQGFSFDPDQQRDETGKWTSGGGGIEGQVSYEANPGPNTGVLPEIQEQPYAVKEEYLHEIRAALVDSDGQDELANAVGLSGKPIEGPGYYKGDFNPGVQYRVSSSSEAPDEMIAKLDAYAAALGLALNQEAVAYHLPLPTSEPKEENAAEIALGHTITQPEMKLLSERLQGAFGKEGENVPLVFSASGVRVLNLTSYNNDTFHAMIGEALSGFGVKIDDYASFRAHLGYVDGGKNGTGYQETLGKTGRPDLRAALGRVRLRTEEVNRRWKERLRKERHAAAGPEEGLGDLPDHPFRGNQWKEGDGGDTKDPLRAKRGITVTTAPDPEDLKNATEKVFGKPVEASQLAALIGAPEGSRVSISIGTGGDLLPALTVNAVADGVVMARSLMQEPNGSTYLYNDSIHVSEKHRGTGTQILADEVEAAKALGVSEIRCYAAGSKVQSFANGYYTWPRLGYDGSLSSEHRSKLPTEMADKLPKSGATVLDLFSVPGGPKWWKENGSSFDAVFSLKPGSRSLKVLGAYLEKRKHSTHSLIRFSSEDAKGEEITLTDEDEAILDEVWSKIQGERAPDGPSETHGDAPGHPFHGNQYTDEGGGDEEAAIAKALAPHTDAVKGYQNFGYTSVNAMLRGDPLFSGDKTGTRLRGMLDSAFKDAPSTGKEMQVFRDLGARAFGGDPSKLVGKVIYDKGYVSTTHDPKIADGFAKKSQGYVMRIKVPTGKRVIPFSAVALGNEREVLLDRGGKFKITGVTKSRGRMVVEAEYL